MPRGNGTGPMGVGAMTGRCRGFCTSFLKQGHLNAGDRRKIFANRRCRCRKRICLLGVLPGFAYLIYYLVNRNK